MVILNTCIINYKLIQENSRKNSHQSFTCRCYLLRLPKPTERKTKVSISLKYFCKKNIQTKKFLQMNTVISKKIWLIGKLKLWIYENNIWELPGEEYYMTEDYCTYILLYNSSACSSHRWFSYIHNFIIILSQVYNELIQWPALSWRLLTQFVRALYQYCRGQIGFESHTSLNFFQAF